MALKKAKCGSVVIGIRVGAGGAGAKCTVSLAAEKCEEWEIERKSKVKKNGSEKWKNTGKGVAARQD